MSHYHLAFIGFGNVGRALARLLLRKQVELESDYGITFSVTGIATSQHGAAINRDGIDLEKALRLSERGESLASLSVEAVPHGGVEFIRICPAGVLFENSPVNRHNGQPAVDHIRAALEQGMHAITANKGAVVFAYAELIELARQHGRRFLFESTVMDGAPIFSLFRGPLPAVELHGLSGILNSSTNVILERMDQGESFEQALAYTQSIGIAETDPSDDIDGWDAAIKVAILATVLMGIPVKPQEVDRQGIRSITPDLLEKARWEGKRWKLICSARRNGTKIESQVNPQLVTPDSPFYSIGGTSSYIQFESDTLPGLGIVEIDPGVETTAYGLLTDFINAVQ